MKSEPINSLNSDVLYSEIDNIAILTLNRPEKLNAYNVNIFNGLKEGIKKIENKENVNAIIITGAGRGFCAGADMDALAATSQGESQGSQIEAEERDYSVNGVKGFEGVFSYFPTVPKPIIAAKNLPAAGVGFMRDDGEARRIRRAAPNVLRINSWGYYPGKDLRLSTSPRPRRESASP